ncbi:ankyrin repeat domain-containing protein [Mannheimia pernigra]|uniref:ankyrin repeat domain-containing protein n=1 Tax=Mannheimia pernigra TaxID=111844 RepID=UPI00307ECF7E
MIEHLISKGLDVNAQDCYGMTPLHYAMRSRNVDAVIALLNAGADPNIENKDQVIPLSMIGAVPKELELIELMLKKGGNVHYFNGQFELIEGMKKYNGNKPEFKAVIELLEKYS